jgi:hypothetical protein
MNEVSLTCPLRASNPSRFRFSKLSRAAWLVLVFADPSA